MENVSRLARETTNGVSDIATRTAEVIGTTVGYVQAHSAEEMIRDAGEAARRNPVPSLIGAATLGVLLGALLRRS